MIEQRWSRGLKARGNGQGHKKNPRPRPSTAFPRTEPLEAKDTRASVLRTKDLQIFFRRSPKEKNNKGLRKFSSRFLGFSWIILKMNKFLLYYCRNQYLNCMGDASPHRKLASPHRDFASPYRDLGVPPSRFERWMIRQKRPTNSGRI